MSGIRDNLRRVLSQLRGAHTPVATAAQMYERMGTTRDFHSRTLKAFATGGWDSAQCVFVLSTGRAGSMQLAAVLAQSPRILALHEPTPTLLHIGARAYAERCEGRHWRELVHGVRDEFIAFAHHEGRIYAETNNRLTYLAPAIAAEFPASKFIHLHRDPAQVIRSGLSRGWYSGGGVDYSLPRPRPDDALAARWQQLSDVEKIAWFWARVNEESIAFLAALPESRRFTLAAADFFRAERQTMDDLFAFIGAPRPDMERIHGALERKLNATRGSGDKAIATDLAVVRPIIAPVAERLGYAC